MSLWANKNDLSMSAGAHVSQEISPLVQLVELNHRVLVNDSEAVFAQLRRLRDKRDVRIGEWFQSSELVRDVGGGRCVRLVMSRFAP